MISINYNRDDIESRRLINSSCATTKDVKDDNSGGIYDRITDCMGALVGTATGAASIPLHLFPGAVKGLNEALSSQKGEKSEAAFHNALIVQNLLLGAGAGMAGGGLPGSIGGAMSSSALTWLLEKKAEKTKAYETMIETIENKVDRVVSEHPPKNAPAVIGNATEGALIGAWEAGRTGARIGYQIGFDATKSVGRGVKWAAEKVGHAAERTVGDAVTGLAGGIYEAGKGIIGDAFNAGAGPAEIRNPERKGLRRLVGAIVGAPLGVISLAVNTVSGSLSGAITGLTHEGTGLNGFLQKACTVIGETVVGGAAGTAVGGPAGALIGGMGGMLHAVLTNRSDASEKIVARTDEKVLKAVGDNDPEAYFIKRTVKDSIEGSITGGAYGAAEGFRKGVDSGAGIVSGLVEGVKGFTGSVAGAYEQEIPADKSETTEKVGFFRTLASLPVNMLKVAAGTVAGTFDSALSMVDGAVQGVSIALKDKVKASAGYHELVLSAGSVLIAGAAGLAIGGTLLPAVAGSAVALCGAGLIHKLNKKTGASERAAEGITRAVLHAQQDNSYLNKSCEKKNIYETFRDGVEGAATGAGAGVREGFREGYSIGSGFVNGVIETIKDCGSRLIYQA